MSTCMDDDKIEMFSADAAVQSTGVCLSSVSGAKDTDSEKELLSACTGSGGMNIRGSRCGAFPWEMPRRYRRIMQ